MTGRKRPVHNSLEMSWIEQQIEEVVALGDRTKSEFGPIGADDMDLKPDPETWSINECLDHLIQTNRRYYEIFDSIASGDYRSGKWAWFPILPRLLGKMVLKAVSPDYKGRSKTSSIFFPLKSSYGKNLTSDFLQENGVLIEKLRRFNEDDLDRIIVASPVSGFITYSLRDCIRILVEHEKRHFNQGMGLKSKLEKGQGVG